MKFSAATEAAIVESRAIVRVGYPWWLRPFLFRGVAAITLSRRIFLSPEMAEHSQEVLDRLLRHELTHVRQVHQHGLVLFLLRYATEFVMHLRSERSIYGAYRRISFEVEARAAEEGEAGSGL